MALPLCPACDHDGVRSIAELSAVPVFCNALWDDRAQARSAPVGDLDLVLCERCGLLWNRAFDEELTAYSPAYENSLHFSPAFQTFARSLAADLVQRYDLHDTSVVEIGAGSGDFLAMVCELGGNRGIGYDPSHDPDRAVPGPVDVVAEHYPIDRPVDARLVCSRHVLEHVTEPVPLLEGVRGSLDPARDTVVYLEVPDATFMLTQPAVWDLIYEHCTYFSEPTLNALCSRAGFKTLRSGRSFGDQYLWVEAGAGEPRAEYPSPDEIAALTAAADGFGDHLRSMIDEWDRRLERMAQDGPVAVWGAAEHFTDATNARRSSTAVNGVIPAYSIVDFSLKYGFKKYLSLEASCNNMLDARYFTRRADAYPGPGIIPSDGRAFYFTVSFRL